MSIHDAKSYILRRLAEGPTSPGDLKSGRPTGLPLADYESATLALIMEGSIELTHPLFGIARRVRLVGDLR